MALRQVGPDRAEQHVDRLVDDDVVRQAREYGLARKCAARRVLRRAKVTADHAVPDRKRIGEDSPVRIYDQPQRCSCGWRSTLYSATEGDLHPTQRLAD